MIITRDIRLRAVEREDLPRFTAWLNQPEVANNLAQFLPFSMSDEEDWFENMRKRPREEHPLVIEIPAADGWKPVGNISLMNLDWIARSAEVGLFIGETANWDQGIGTKALRLMLRHAFQTLNLNRVFLRVFDTNPRGIHVYEKVGFIYEGRLRQALYLNGSYHDILIMSVLRDEWLSREE